MNRDSAEKLKVKKRCNTSNIRVRGENRGEVGKSLASTSNYFKEGKSQDKGEGFNAVKVGIGGGEGEPT